LGRVRPYTELPDLAEIVLEESYVLGITAEPGTVTFDIDFVLTRDHSEYVEPSPSERECFRRGSMRLSGVRRLTWDAQGAPPATDATGEQDFGHIDSFEWEDGKFLLHGDWGRLEAEADKIETTLRRV
jgi:hypothetical protein